MSGWDSCCLVLTFPLEKSMALEKGAGLLLLDGALCATSGKRSCPGPPRAGGWLRCSSQAGQGPRETLVSLGHRHTPSHDEPWWSGRVEGGNTYRKRLRRKTGGGDKLHLCVCVFPLFDAFPSPFLLSTHTHQSSHPSPFSACEHVCTRVHTHTLPRVRT